MLTVASVERTSNLEHCVAIREYEFLLIWIREPKGPLRSKFEVLFS